MASLQDVRETLQLNNGASNLVQPVIDRMLFEGVRKYKPLRRVLPRQTWLTNTYFFNRRTKYAVAQAVQEAPPVTGTGSVAATNSTYLQIAFPIKHYQVNLDLSNFAIQVARVNGNLVDLELKGAAEAMVYLEEMFHLFGSAGATLNTLRPAWDGADLLLATGNKLDGGTQVATIAMLDAMIDKVKSFLADELGANFFFLLSPQMLSAINRLFIQYARWTGTMKIFTRDDYGIPNAPVVDNYMDAGLEVATYRGIPLIESSFLDSLGTVSATSAVDAGGSGSQLANQAYYYVIEAVSDYGITTASNEVTVTPTAGHNVTLTWSTPTILDAYGNSRQILFYRIHRSNAASNASGTESLYAYVSALDNTDTAITTFTDTGLPILPASTPTAYAVTVAVSGSAAVPDGVTFPRIQTGSQIVQDIFLLPRDPDLLVVPAVNEISTKLLAPVNARTQQLALIADEVLALRAPTFGAKLCRVRSA